MEQYISEIEELFQNYWKIKESAKELPPNIPTIISSGDPL